MNGTPRLLPLVVLKPFLKSAVDAGQGEEPWPLSLAAAVPTDWSKDNWVALQGYEDSPSKDGIWVANASTKRTCPFLATESDEGDARFSPDGKWIAYTSDESGRSEVYIRPHSGEPGGAEGRIQVSVGGGDFPAWRPNSGELYFLSMDSKLQRLDVRHLEAGRNRVETLFPACAGTGLNARLGTSAFWEYPYDPAPDGRFLFNCLSERPGRFVVWMNWRSAFVR